MVNHRLTNRRLWRTMVNHGNCDAEFHEPDMCVVLVASRAQSGADDHNHSHVAARAVANGFHSNPNEAPLHRARTEHDQLDRRPGAQGLAFGATARSMAGWLAAAGLVCCFGGFARAEAELTTATSKDGLCRTSCAKLMYRGLW